MSLNVLKYTSDTSPESVLSGWYNDVWLEDAI